MADTGAPDAAREQYNPFIGETAHHRDQRYWCDRGLWSAYQASVVLITLEERDRCRKIIQTYLERVPNELRGTLLELIGEI